jgi:hypothetical protein
MSELSALYNKVVTSTTTHYVWDCSFELVRIYAKSRGISADAYVATIETALKNADVEIETIQLKWDRTTCRERKAERYTGTDLQVEVDRIDAVDTELLPTKPKDYMDIIKYIISTTDGCGIRTFQGFRDDCG